MALQTDTTLPSSNDELLFDRISWPAVIAGVVIASVLQIMLSLLGLGIGASTIDPLQEQNPMQGLGAGAGIWLAGTTLLSLFAGGWVAGKLAGLRRHRDGALHGLVTWGLTSILTFMLVGSVMGAVFGRAATAATNNAAQISESTTGVTEERAREAGDLAARRTSQAALWSFAALALGALASAIGGMAGAPNYSDDVRTSRRGRDEYSPRPT